MPSLYIIAGPNGAGKTTFIKRFAPRRPGERVMNFSKQIGDSLIAAAEGRPSSSCHPERSAARLMAAVAKHGAWGRAGRRAVEGPLAVSARPARRQRKFVVLRLRDATHT